MTSRWAAVAAALRALADAVEIDEEAAAAPVLAPEAWADRRPAWLEERPFQRFLDAAETRRVGRKTLYRPSDLAAWVERHPVKRHPTKRDEPAHDAPDDDDIDFEEFKRTALRPRVICKHCGRDFVATVTGNPREHKCVKPTRRIE